MGCKIAAGWLIETSGGKSLSVGDVAVHQNQALVLVNLGQGNIGTVVRIGFERFKQK